MKLHIYIFTICLALLTACGGPGGACSVTPGGRSHWGGGGGGPPAARGGNKTRFACVDGPFFDAHQVDWEELWDRRAAYDQDEPESLERTDPVDGPPDRGQAEHACRCGG